MSVSFVLYVISCLSTVSANILPRSPIGFGVQKLQKQKSKGVLQSVSVSCDNVKQYWFKEAVIDNFSPIENQKFWVGNGQRYWINKQLWGGPGFPIFVFIGGEGEESCSRLTNYLYMYNLAQEFSGLLVDIEHRFYGESYPTEDMSTENYQYLTSEQALADLARLIGKIKTDLNTEKSKVITLSGSYPGNLAAWFRLKYPSVTAGSIASSAPVLAQTNFPQYMDVVAQAMRQYSGQTCFDAFETAANQVASLAAQGVGSEGVRQLEKDFQTCWPVESERDIAILLSDLMGNVQGTVQYNNVIAGSTSVADICSVMLETEDAYAQFVQLQTQYLAASGRFCEDARWSASIAYLSSTQKDASNMARPWTYQTCNEFGYFQTTDSATQPFRSWRWLNLDFYRDICSAAFDGWTADPQVDWVNQAYGDVRIAGTNIVFVTGSTDPWHAIAVNNHTAPLPQPSEVAVFIDSTAHCMDLYAPQSTDSSALTAAREVIRDNVAKWLA